MKRKPCAARRDGWTAQILPGILALLLLLCLAACQNEQTQDFSFEEREDGLWVTAIRINARNVTIPESFEGKPVKGVKEYALYRNEMLRSLSLPSSIVSVGAGAFADCPYLSRVSFAPGGACEIQDGAFENCPLLVSVSFHDSVFSIGDAAFKNCKRIFTLDLSRVETIGADAFMNCERTIFTTGGNESAAVYASENHLCTGFFSSVYFTYLLLLLAVCLTVGILLFLRRRAKKQKKSLEKTKNKEYNEKRTSGDRTNDRKE